MADVSVTPSKERVAMLNVPASDPLACAKRPVPPVNVFTSVPSALNAASSVALALSVTYSLSPFAATSTPVPLMLTVFGPVGVATPV